jgi:hypothetical protein
VSRGLAFLVLLAALLPAGLAHAQGGPPFFTTDPGTPGNGNWEINLGATGSRQGDTRSYELPQLDLNYGLGESLQISAELPYVVQSASGAPRQQGWSNALVGIKWHFIDVPGGGWQVSTFPQIETAGSQSARHSGLATEGPRLLLPLEIARRVGSVDINLEAGYFLPRNGSHERFLGLAVGRQLNRRLELDGEVFADRVSGEPTDVILDAGFRYRFYPGFVLLGMAGRSINGSAAPHSEFTGYLGLQILLRDYGRRLAQEQP